MKTAAMFKEQGLLNRRLKRQHAVKAVNPPQRDELKALQVNTPQDSGRRPGVAFTNSSWHIGSSVKEIKAINIT